MINLNITFNYEQMPMQFTLSVQKGERVAIVGESGAGKSTLLNLIAGFDLPTSGEIWLNNCNHTQTEVASRPVSMLFQDNNLFPHLTVEQNIGLALVPSLKLNTEQKAQVAEIADKMGIAEFLARRADQLSGGQNSGLHWLERCYAINRFYYWTNLSPPSIPNAEKSSSNWLPNFAKSGI